MHFGSVYLTYTMTLSMSGQYIVYIMQMGCVICKKSQIPTNATVYITIVFGGAFYFYLHTASGLMDHWTDLHIRYKKF